jgi:multidrug efflux pump subunit AcrA (membrane-fusion protein)
MAEPLMSDVRKTRLFTLFRSEPQLLRALTVYSILIGFFSLFVPIAVQSVVNSLLSTAMMQPVILISLFVFSILAFVVFLNVFRKIAYEYFERRLFVSVAHRFLKDAANLHSGSASKFLEIGAIEKTTAVLLIDGIALVLQMILGTILLITYHPLFLIYSFFLILISTWGIRRFGEKGFKYSVELSDQKYKILNRVSVGSVVTEPEQSLLIKGYLDLRVVFFRLVLWQNILFWTIPVVGSVLLLVLGSYLIIENQLSVGQLVAAELVTTSIFVGMSKMGKILESIYDFNASLKKVESTVGLSAPNDEKPTILNLPDLVPQGRMMRMTHRFWWYGIAFLVIIAILPWVQTAPGTGRVLAFSPNEREQRIDAPVEGRVKKWWVVEGSPVKKGDPICELIDNDPEILTRLRTERDALLRRLEAAKLGAFTANNNINRQKKLFEQGLSSERNVESAKLDYVRQVTDEANAGAELSRLDVRLARQTNQQITAPIDGTILSRAPGQEGALLKAGEMLAILVPTTDSRIVEIFVNGLDVPLIKTQQSVRLQFEGWPAIQFAGWPSVAIGTFGGVVKFVDAAASSSGLFRVLIEPAVDEAWPNAHILRQGVRAKAWIRLNRVPIGFELWRQLNGFPVSLPHENIYVPEEKKNKSDDKKADEK